MDAVLVRNADRMMLSAALREDGIGLIFATGAGGWFPSSTSRRSGAFGDLQLGVA